jgi:hypothetical protein
MLQARQHAVTTPSLRGAAFSREELATWRAVAIQVVVPPPMDCFRHCEERSDVAIIAMTGRGAMTLCPAIARWGGAFSRQQLATWWVLAIQESGPAGRQVGGKAGWQGRVASACRVTSAVVISAFF